MRGVLGWLLGVVARVWLMTLRLTVEVHPSLLSLGDRPWVLSFLHGKQWPLLAWKRRRPTAVMVSLSADGEMQARALRMLGFTVVRGSSSRGGSRALAALVRHLKRGGHDAAFAVDGPRGPYGVPKPGVVLAARAGRAVIVPMGSAIAGAKIFARAWDRFALAWPFSRVVVVLGQPVELSSAGEDAEVLRHLATSIADANVTAQAILTAGPRSMLRFSKSFPLSRKRSRSV